MDPLDLIAWGIANLSELTRLKEILDNLDNTKQSKLV
jgi:hypothetical protein